MNKQPPTLLMNGNDIKSVFGGRECEIIGVIEDAFKKRFGGSVILPDKSSQIFDEATQNRINCMPASILSDKVSGVKLVSVFPENPKAGFENVTGTIILSELERGHTKAVMDGTYITSIRTAGVGAIAAKYLAKKGARSIGFIGAGREARTHLDMIKLTCPEIKICRVSSRSDATVSAFIEEEAKKHPDIEFTACGCDYESAVSDADIIVTATSTQADLLKAKWIKKGALYIHVGGWEDEYAVPRLADKIVCDEWECIKHRTQTISRMFKEGLLLDSDIYSDLADIICEKKPARESEDEFIYFCSVGLAFIDIAVADHAYRESLKAGLGTYYQF